MISVYSHNDICLNGILHLFASSITSSYLDDYGFPSISIALFNYRFLTNWNIYYFILL